MSPILSLFTVFSFSISTVNSLAVANNDASHPDTISWHATSGTATSAKLIFSSPSSMDPAATLEVKERAGGWRTVGLVGGKTKSIYHGIYRVDKHGVPIANVLASKNLQTMASVAFASTEGKEKASFLYLGLGAGALPSFIHHYFRDSRHVAVELDEAVVLATESIRLKDRIDIRTGDALNYCRSPSEECFDCIFVDIFDGANLLPIDFYGGQFVERLRDDILKPTGTLIQNFHTGNKKLGSQLDDAKEVFSRSFGRCYLVRSPDSKPNAGNTILVGSKRDPYTSDGALREALSAAAENAQRELNFAIDSSSILAGARLVHAVLQS